MSTNISIHAFTGKENPEFKKHLGAVEYCIKHGLSYPKETSEFFSDKLMGDSLEDINPDFVMKYIENGVPVPLSKDVLIEDKDGTFTINVRKLPAHVDEIMVMLS